MSTNIKAIINIKSPLISIRNQRNQINVFQLLTYHLSEQAKLKFIIYS